MERRGGKRKRAEADNYVAYSYEELLARAMVHMAGDRASKLPCQRHVMAAPRLMRVGRKRTLWTNYESTCRSLNRPPAHVRQYFRRKLKTEVHVEKHQLLIKGRYVPKYLATVLRTYVAAYVICRSCASDQTSMVRDSITRVHMLQCSDCGAINSSRTSSS
jgi:translation initiation factor 2 subunit 2